MCGIAGYFGPKKIEEQTILQTLSLMKRRGPDAQKHTRIQMSDHKVCDMLHSRLSILDLDPRSDQPFSYKDKTLIFNGEIYNYLEVKAELINCGHIFVTKSDTEVLIHALDEWGMAALDKIEGMWAFALFDASEKTLYLSRDPFGEKPLYIYEPSPGEVYFGSEIKTLASLSALRFTPNLNHISRFLVNGYKGLFKGNETWFRQISEVPPATYMRFDQHTNVRQQKYWYPKALENPDLDFNDAVKKTRELLIQSVEKRLRSDIPIAFHMSGGVDSNALISIAKRVFNYDVHGFTISNTDERYEEQDMIDISVKELGIKHSSFPCAQDHFLDNLREIVRYHDGPVITISFYLHWLLQREVAKEKYHISISGTAADELFSGYFDHQLMYFYDIKNDKNLLSQSAENWKRDIAGIIRNPLLQSHENFIHDPFQRGHAYLKNDIYATYLVHPWHEPFEEKYFRSGLLQNRMYNEMFHETTPISLHEDDLNSMYFSIENRSPFLDRQLFEFAHSIPAKHLIKDGKAKMVLREAMRGIVADPILDNKRKVGFNAPFFDLVSLQDKAVQDKLLEDSPIFEILQKKPIKDMLAMGSHPNSDSKFLFSFISSKLFLEEFAS